MGRTRKKRDDTPQTAVFSPYTHGDPLGLLSALEMTCLISLRAVTIAS